MNKKKFVGFLIALMLLVGVGFTQNANAASNWNQTSQGWTYTENGTQKTRWLKDGGNWYYLGYDGLMKKGWVNDEGTWYYLIENGTLDNSKTTTAMPAEVKSVYDIVQPFITSGNLKYHGIVQVKQGTRLYTVGLNDRFLYRFTTEDNYQIQMGEYYYDPTDGKVYNLAQDGEVSFLGAGSTEYAIKMPVTKEQALENVKKYITENKEYSPKII